MDKRSILKVINQNKEDEAIVSLVEKLGTKNWTLVASKMAEKFKNNIRTGKQCRER